MKKLKFILILTFSCTAFAQSGWYGLPSGTTWNLNDIFFVNENIGFAAGDNRTLLKTTDSGNSWNVVNVTVPAQTNILNVRFFDINTGLLFSHGTYKTTNSGNSWYLVNDLWFPAVGNLINDSTMFLANGGSIYKSTNRGETWNAQSTNQSPAAIYFANYNTGWAISISVQGPPPYIYYYLKKTTDSGVQWTTQYTLSGPSGCSGMWAPYFPTIDTGYFGGTVSQTGRNYIFRTYDSGLTWDTVSTPSSIGHFFFISPKTGWACGNGNVIGKTTNAGINWILTQTGTSGYLSALYFVNQYTGFASGYNGIILKTTNGGVTSSQTISSGIPNSFSLYQNYPNPFNPNTSIKFSVPQQAFVTINVYNVLGEEVIKLVNGEFSSGTYETNWDASNYSSGVYYYQLTAKPSDRLVRSDGYNETKKMVLIK